MKTNSIIRARKRLSITAVSLLIVVQGLIRLPVTAEDVPTVRLSEVGRWPEHLWGSPTALAIDGFSTRLVIADVRGVQILDVGSADRPHRIGGCPTPGEALGVAVTGQWVYVADGLAGIHVIDIHDPYQPQIVASHDTPGYARAVAVTGDLACVADSGGGLQVLDISERSLPRQMGEYRTSGPVYAVTPIPGSALVCLTRLDSWDQSGIDLVDLTDPTSPIRLGTIDTGGEPRSLVVSGSHAYVANWIGLQVIDISDPAHPLLVAEHSTAGQALHLDVSRGFAYIADRDYGLYVVDVRDPKRPQRWGRYRMDGPVSAVIIGPRNTYLIEPSRGIRVLDVREPEQIVSVGLATTRHAMDPRPIAIADGHVYYLAFFGLLVLDVRDPANPVLASEYRTSATIKGIALARGYAYVAADWAGTLVLDVLSPSRPELRTVLDHGGPSEGVAVAGTFAAIAAGASGLKLFDVSDPRAPKLVGSLETEGFCRAVALGDGHAYLGVGDQETALEPRLIVVDLSDPTEPKRVGCVRMEAMPRAVTLVGDTVYLADGDGIQIIDVQDPANPMIINRQIGESYVNQISVFGPYAYVSDFLAGLRVIDIRDPSRLRTVGRERVDGYASGVAAVGDYVYLSGGGYAVRVLRVDELPAFTELRITSEGWLRIAWNDAARGLRLQRSSQIPHAGWRDLIGSEHTNSVLLPLWTGAEFFRLVDR
jgi:hypothetical protein